MKAKIFLAIIIFFCAKPILGQQIEYYEGKLALGNPSIGWYKLATFDLAGNGAHNSVIVDAEIDYIRTSEMGYSANAKLFIREGTSQGGKWHYDISGTEIGDYLKYKKINDSTYELFGYSTGNYAHISIRLAVTREAALIVTIPTAKILVPDPDIFTDVPKASKMANLIDNLGIGTVTPKSKVHIYNGASGRDPHGFTDLSVEDDGAGMITILTPNTQNAYYGFADTDDDFVGGIQYYHPSNTMYFRVNNHSSDMMINKDGNVGIGTTTPDTYRLAVKGKIRAEEVKVETGWADYVFEEDYDLPTLAEVEKHIKEKGHLINIPSAKEVEKNGVQLGEMNKLLLEKIEELTLYNIEQQKQIFDLKNEISIIKELVTKPCK